MVIGIGTGQRIAGILFSRRAWREERKVYSQATIKTVVYVLSSVVLLGFGSVIVLAVMGKEAPHDLIGPLGTALGGLMTILINPGQTPHSPTPTPESADRMIRDRNVPDRAVIENGTHAS